MKSFSEHYSYREALGDVAPFDARHDAEIQPNSISQVTKLSLLLRVSLQ